MKKIISLLMAGILILMLTGCNNQNIIPREPSTTAPIDIPAESPTSAPIDEPTAASDIAADNNAYAGSIDWTEISYSEQDNEGYTFDVTIKLSPWILLSNTDMINAAWSEVGKGNELPGFDDWGLKKDNEGCYFTSYSSNINNGHAMFNQGFWGYKMSDMYYCVGSVSIKNTTEGWSFSEDNTHTAKAQMQCLPKGTTATSMSKVFFNNKTDSCWNGIDVIAKMKSDNWGPVPFIIMCPENYTPDNPDGAHIDTQKTRSFEIYTRRDIEPVQVGTYGKDGEYFEPVMSEEK